MNRWVFLLASFLSIQASSYAQIVTTDPEFPTAGEPVTIFFDATEGTGGLANYNGDIYAHTGVITSESTSNSDWKYVVADWGVNVPKAKMERVKPDLYKLEITPGIRDYYGVPEDEAITHIAFVFRNSDGSREGKADGGEDIFVQVYEDQFNVKFLEPEQDLVFRKQSETLSVTGVGSGEGLSIDLSLFIDDQLVKQVTNDTIRYTYNAQNQGTFEITLTGTDGTESDTLSKTLVIYPEQTDQDRPPDLKDGITYIDDSTVRLSLFAPYKKFVYLIGDFNNWQIQPEYLMKRDSINADSIYYWTEISGLTPGQEYAFQYLVDGEIRVADPYSEKILDPFNDQYIPESIYPDLKPYPQGKTEFIVGVLQPGKEEYDRQTTDYDRPDKEDLVIYELLIRDFVEDHDYETMTDTLDYLDPERQKLYKTFQALIRLRNAHPAFTSEESTVALDLDRAVKRITISHPDMSVSIIGNFGVTPATVKPSFAQTGKWYTFFSGDSLNVADTDTTVTLNAGELYVYTTKKFKSPDEDLLQSGTDDRQNEEESQFRLWQNYPNPFMATTSIPYRLPEQSTIVIRIFNVLGQEVMKQIVGEQPAGTHEAEIDISGLASGLYFYRLQAGSRASTRKMMLIR